MKFRYYFTSLFTVLTLIAGKSVLAQSTIAIDYNTKAFQSRKLQAGIISVSVSYEPYKMGQGISENTKNLHYQISYDGQVKFTGEDLTLYTGEVSLKDLDGDRSSEVLVSSFSGGAHCCTNIKIYFWDGNHFLMKQTGLLDGSGGTFQDLDGDGKQEFLTSDNAFLYTFSSYAGSFPPSAIYAFQNGQLKDVTRKYPKYLNIRLQEMFKVLQKKESDEKNGVLAGYVAQKALLGEFQQGWEFLLANYDRSSDWGLTRYNKNGQEIGRYPDFPTALKALLIQRGYLNANTGGLPSNSGHPSSLGTKTKPTKNFKTVHQGYCTFLSANNYGDIVNDPCTIFDDNGVYQIKWSDGVLTSIVIEPKVEIDGVPASIIRRSSTSLTIKGSKGNTGFCWNCHP